MKKLAIALTFTLILLSTTIIFAGDQQDFSNKSQFRGGYQIYPDGTYGPQTDKGYQIYPDGTYGPQTGHGYVIYPDGSYGPRFDYGDERDED